MPRSARIVYPGVPHHVTQHGNNNQYILKSDTFKKKLLELIRVRIEIHDIQVISYCIMDNHYHFIVTPQDMEAMAKTFGEVSMMFSQYYNSITGSAGHVWKDRYFSYPLDREHFYEAVRYVEMNPVRAELVKDPLDYKWSSAKSHINNINDPLITGTHELLEDIDDWHGYLLNKPDEIKVSKIQKKVKIGRPH